MNSIFNLDTTLFAGFLIVTLIVGIMNNSKVKTINDYALGGRNFSTGALVATIVATYASASGFFADLNSTYSDGLFYIIPALCMVFSLLIIAYILVPKMGEFLGNVSVAEAIGNIYGREARVITAVAGSIAALGAVAVQFKAFGNVTSYFMDIPRETIIMISGIVVTIYSSFGGIRAVTSTDILQFFTFGFALPLIGIMIWNQIYLEHYSIADILHKSSNFKLSELVNVDNPKFWPMVFLMFYFTIPTLHAATFQRILIGKDLYQVKRAFIISAALIALVIVATCWISFLVLNVNDKLETSQLLGFIIDNYTYNGLKGLIVVGVVAMAMSTADSILNATSVLFAYDILGPLNIGTKNQLAVSKSFSLCIGFVAIIFAIYGTDFLKIILTVNSFYMPIVTVPLIFAILGFRSSRKSALIAMGSGFLVVVTIKLFSLDLDPIFFGTMTNFGALFASHYLLKQPGGWVGIKDKKAYRQLIAMERKLNIRTSQYVDFFNFIKYCKKYSPDTSISYTALGIYFVIFTITTMYSTQSVLLNYNKELALGAYQIMMITGIVIATYPIWPLSIKQPLKENIAKVAWPITSFYMLVVFNTLFMLISNFSLLQFSIFSVNLVITAIIVGWRLAIFMTPIGLYIGWACYDSFFSHYNINFAIGSPGLVCAYMLVIIGTTLVVFIKPREEKQLWTEEKNEDLSSKASLQEMQVKDAWNLREEFIRNISHEYHAPMTGISSMAESLKHAYYKLGDEERLKAIDVILKSAVRLEIFDSNISSLASINKRGFKLKMKHLNFSDLVYKSIAKCRRLYETNREDRQFEFDIDDDIMFDGDMFYLGQVLDNLIINAISYCPKGKITICLTKNGNKIEFSISDTGIGIPEGEFKDIFGTFFISSKTKTPAGGRGLGLSLCKRVIELHEGTIGAENNKDGEGSTFRFNLPLSKDPSI